MVHGGIGEAARIRGTDQRTRQAALEPVSFFVEFVKVPLQNKNLRYNIKVPNEYRRNGI